ncbi:MAG: LOG family protein [Geminicoccaceae bacterium]
MRDAPDGGRRLPSAGEDLASARPEQGTPQTRSPSYRLAYADQEFLLRDELRPVRLQLELLKPELALAERGIDATIVVFGSRRVRAPEASGPQVAITKRRPGCVLDAGRTYDAARAFARLVSRAGQAQGPARRFVVVTGGGPGVMEAANRGAHDVGAESVGLNIVLPEEQIPNPYVTPELSFQFHYFAIRKLHFMLRARALVCFPGGFGTLDELFEALTLIQTGKAEPMPILLFDETYWRRIVNFDAMVEEGVISPEDRDLVRYVESAEAAWRAICAHYGVDPGLADGS